MAITDYFRDVRAEMKHVSWPTRRLAIAYTAELPSEMAAGGST